MTTLNTIHQNLIEMGASLCAVGANWDFAGVNWNDPRSKDNKTAQVVKYISKYYVCLNHNGVTIDIDVKNNKQGLSNLYYFLKYAPVPKYIVSTKSGGFHLYYLLDPESRHSDHTRLGLWRSGWAKKDVDLQFGTKYCTCGPTKEITVHTSGYTVAELCDELHKYHEPEEYVMLNTGAEGVLDVTMLRPFNTDDMDKHLEYTKESWKKATNRNNAMRDYVVVGNKYGFPPAILYEEGVRMLPLFDQKKPGAPTESELRSMIDRLWDENNVVAKRDGEVKVKQSKKDDDDDKANSLATVTDLILADESLNDKLRYNEMTLYTEMLGNPEYPDDDDRSWNTVGDRFTLWLIDKYQRAGTLSDSCTTSLMYNAITRAGERARVNPLKDYLKSLVWDKKPRIDVALRTYCNAEGSDEYVNMVSRTFFISAVARALSPGCQVDTMVILEGGQGVGKSSLFSIIGGDYYAEWSQPVSDKNILYTMMKAWIVDLSELAGMASTSINALKSFLTIRSDTVRLAYARSASTIKRSSIFVGTTNDSQYLRDTTGNRRFLPVKIGAIDLDAVRKDKDQLWAEAVYRYYAGDAYHPTDAWINDIGRLETEKRLVVADDLVDYIASYIRYIPEYNPMVAGQLDFRTKRDTELDTLSLNELKTSAPRMYTNDVYKNALQSLGFSCVRLRVDGVRTRRWVKDVSKYPNV